MATTESANPTISESADSSKMVSADQDSLRQGNTATGEYEMDEHDTLETVWGGGTLEHTAPVEFQQFGLAGAQVPMAYPPATTVDGMVAMGAAPAGSTGPFPLSMPIPQGLASGPLSCQGSPLVKQWVPHLQWVSSKVAPSAARWGPLGPLQAGLQLQLSL